MGGISLRVMVMLKNEASIEAVKKAEEAWQLENLEPIISEANGEAYGTLPFSPVKPDDSSS